MPGEENQPDKRAAWIFNHPIAVFLPVRSKPEEDQVWIVEFPHGSAWWYWPYDASEPWRTYLDAFSFDRCLELVRAHQVDSTTSYPQVPVHRWRIRNVENDKEVMYVGLIV